MIPNIRNNKTVFRMDETDICEYTARDGGGGGVDGTPARRFGYAAVFRNDFTFSGKPLIF